MPAHLTSYLIMLPILALIVWRRVSRSFGRQRIRRKRMIARVVIFAIIGGLLALSGFHHLALAEGLLGGVLIGYYIVYYGGVLVHHRRFLGSQPADAAARTE